MKAGEQIRRAAVCVGVMLTLTAIPVVAQRHGQESRQAAPRSESRPQPRSESRPQPRNEARSQEPRPQFQPPPREFHAYSPPAQGHHSGQWLNQHREQPLDQQRRALENDPQFRRLPAERQQKLEQRLQRFDSMTAERQQQVLRRMETWEHLTPQQKQEFRGIGSEYNSLPPDRRQAVRNAIESLRAMPPAARQREIESGRFSQFSPQERQILNGASRLPLAPSENGSSQPASAPQNGQRQRYIPRPPQ